MINNRSIHNIPHNNITLFEVNKCNMCVCYMYSAHVIAINILIPTHDGIFLLEDVWHDIHQILDQAQVVADRIIIISHVVEHD